MTDARQTPPLARRVPGASGSGPGRPARPVLPDALLRRMQAAVEAERAAEAGEAEPAGQGAPQEMRAAGPRDPVRGTEPPGACPPSSLRRASWTLSGQVWTLVGICSFTSAPADFATTSAGVGALD